jgi:predicted ribosomally synthesized peptide with nif11-like leader
MSKENAQKFLADVVADNDLKTTLLATNAQNWVSSAKSKGYEISVEELADELIGRIRELFTGELGDDSLEAVAGGAGTSLPQKISAQKISPIAAAGVKLNPAITKLPGNKAGRW